MSEEDQEILKILSDGSASPDIGSSDAGEEEAPDPNGEEAADPRNQDEEG